jgi:hypothetical protein
MTKSQKKSERRERRAHMEIARITREKELAQKHRTFWQAMASILKGKTQ